MKIQTVTRYTGNVIFNSDTGSNELEKETVIQVRLSEDEEWQDVPSVDETQ